MTKVLGQFGFRVLYFFLVTVLVVAKLVFRRLQ